MTVTAQRPSPPAGATGNACTRAGEAVHAIVAAALAGALAGIIAGGLGGRIAMRITAIMATSAEQGTLTEADERIGDITLAGTLGLMVFGGMLLGIVGGFVYVACARWFGGFGAWRGLAFGLFLLMSLGWAIIEGDNFDFSTLGSVAVNVAMFAVIYIGFGVLVAPLHDWACHWLPKPSASVRFVAASPLYAVGLFLAAGVVGIIGSGGGEDGREAPWYTIVPAYLMLGPSIAGVGIARMAGRFDRFGDLVPHRGAMAAALSVMVLPLAVGLALDAQSLNEMLREAY